MLANKSSSPPGQNAVREIAIDLPLKIRIYNQNSRIEQAPRSLFVPTSEDPGTTGVATRDAVIDRDTGVAARLFLPIAAVATGRRLPLILFFHGGGGSSLAAAAEPQSAFCRTYHRYATALAARAGALVVSVEYRRLSPEHACDDAWTALRWAAASSADPWILYHADRRRTFLAGDGAGGGVACRAAVRARRAGDEDVDVEGMLLVDPYFGEREWWIASEKAGHGGGLLSPAEDTPLPCWRALVVAVAGKGAAAWERGRRLAATVRGGCWWGGEVTVVELHGVHHGFHLYGSASGGSASERLMESIVEFVNRKDGEQGSNLSNGPCKAVSAQEAPRRAVTKSCL
ncbi:unnamed protein product [Urochloa decumbens]|uniref:Alpha/beta hydrolase fold-3 domain-containing protein n=1 Tax=Urochloa decumbens TaxID=240449 RepID=A0ABC9DRN5_9POAL